MRSIIYIILFFLFTLGIGAQTMKPGLWEMKSEMQNAEMDEAMASICKQDIVEKKQGYLKLKFTCTNPASKGESEINFQSETSFKGKYSITQGTGEKMDMTQSGKWLGDSCGNLKPVP